MNLENLGRVGYATCYAAMQAFTRTRTEATADALWICEHEAVYTQGLAGKSAHILESGAVPVVQTDRGGQVTFHGPGQVVAYPLMDLKRAGYYVKEFVYRLEEAVIRTLAHWNVTGHRVPGAPGIYVRLADPRSHAVWCPAAGSDPFVGLGKIAVLGIKVTRHCSYHGLALNVAMDLEPFSRIHPCGYAGLQTVDLLTVGVSVSWQEVAEILSNKLALYLAP